MKVIDFQDNTIVMLIGPTNCGKSYFATNYILPFLAGANVRYKYLSSDEKRRELLGFGYHKHDKIMSTASVQAFNLLHTELDLYTQYPINTPVVIVDATNLSKTARGFIYEIAAKNAYRVVAIVFDYANMDEYTQHVTGADDKKLIYNMVTKLKKETIRELEGDKIEDIYKVLSNDFSTVGFRYTTSSVGIKLDCSNICIVGDIHGCYDEFLDVLRDNKGVVIRDAEDGENGEKMFADSMAIVDDTYVHHLLIGDYLDKGPVEGQRKMIVFLYNNIRYFTIVRGNHERWVYNYLRGVIKPSEDTALLIDGYFDSVKMLQADEELKNMFLKLYESSYDFAYTDKFTATHAPCEAKYIGKADKVSLKKQNTIMYPKQKDYNSLEAWMDATEDFFKFLERDAEGNQPYHVFGHVMLPSVYTFRNKIGIDTGCVVGNLLSTVTFAKGKYKPFIKNYKSKQEKTKELYPLFRTKSFEVDIKSLDAPLAKRLMWMAKNKVNFVSGTMSPCNIDGKELESIKSGIEYYRKAGVDFIIAQPKYMGSRCNMLLHRSKAELCKSFSRNAYEIKQDRIHSEQKLFHLYKDLQETYAHLFEQMKAEYLLLDGELLPWNVMGKDLIEKDFKLALKAGNSELALMRETGFEDLYCDLVDKMIDVAELSEDNRLKLPKHVANAYTVFDNFKNEYMTIDNMQEALSKYETQLSLFGVDGTLKFNPFAILKAISFDGREVNFVSSDVENSNMFMALNPNTEMLILDYKNDRFGVISNDNSIGFATDEKAYNYYWDQVTKNKQMEGVVLKPGAVYIPGVAPYLKCRNPEYLRLVYGFDYDYVPGKLDKLLSHKNTNRKLAFSIKEWELGRQLLDIPMKDISVDNKKWLGLAVQLITEQQNEHDLDPRL